MGVSINGGSPKWMVSRENPIKIDDLGVPLFQLGCDLFPNIWKIYIESARLNSGSERCGLVMLWFVLWKTQK